MRKAVPDCRSKDPSRASAPITERGCRLLALFGTLFCGGAWKTEENAEG
jgi:hypothetical protein